MQTPQRPPYPWYFFLSLPLIAFGVFDLVSYAINGRLHGMNVVLCVGFIVAGVVLNKVGFRVGRQRMERASAEPPEPPQE